MRENVSILGSTGSVGRQALSVAESLGLTITALAAGKDGKLLEEQARKFRPACAALADEAAAADLKVRLADTDVKVLGGEEGVMEAAAMPCEMSLAAITGLAGLRPVLASMEAGNPLALANKESLVCGGHLIRKIAREKKIPVMPVDSEHSAIFQCFAQSKLSRPARRIILTASGGPFFGKTRRELVNVTPEQALNHPTWSMGDKITIDSATMMNKGLEIIEAMWLFGLPLDKIDIIVHRESIIHSMVEFSDGSVLAQMGLPDMRLPIQLAFTWPERSGLNGMGILNFAKLGAITFYEPDESVFSCLKLARRAVRSHNCVVLNGANEQAVELFLKGGQPEIPVLCRPQFRR
jgi:1-deoxy-D-xylulose-5-phosphate reductoisomerase